MTRTPIDERSRDAEEMDPSAPEVPPEWWERLGRRRREWCRRHEAAVRRLVRGRAILMWAAVALTVAVAVWRPELRSSLRAYFEVAALVVVWFVLARTKTLSWRFVGTLFSLCLPWSLGVVWLSFRAQAWAGVSGDGASVGIAPLFEETLKLAPLAVLAVAAPGRVRRFAAADWAVVGFTCGAAFAAVEEASAPCSCGRRAAASSRCCSGCHLTKAWSRSG